MTNYLKPITPKQQVLPTFSTEVVLMSEDQPANDEPFYKVETQTYLASFVSSVASEVIFNAMKNSHKSAGSELVENVIIQGDVGVGKSVLCRKYANKYPSHILEDTVIMPVIYLQLPQSATDTDIVNGLLEVLCNKLNFIGSGKKNLSRLIMQLNAAHTRFIIIDEAQNIDHTHRGNDVSQVIKSLSYIQDKTRIPFAFSCTHDFFSMLERLKQVGIKKVKKIEVDKLILDSNVTGSEKNAALAFIRRTRNTVNFPSFKFYTKHWGDVLNECWQYFPRDSSFKDLPMLNERIFIATQGRLGFVTKLLKEVLEITESNSQIDLKDFSKAIRNCTMKPPCGFDPFEATDPKVTSHMQKIVKAREKR